MTPDEQAAQIHQCWELTRQPGDIVEFRSLKNGAYGTISGYFDAPGELIKTVNQWSKVAKNIYVTLNPVKPELFDRRRNRADRNVPETTNDSDILSRRLNVRSASISFKFKCQSILSSFSARKSSPVPRRAMFIVAE
jgi:hypothetical protein